MNSCTACASPIDGQALETCHEPVYGRDFKLHLCRACGVVFTEPQDDFPLVQWYEKASAMYGEVEYSVHAKAEDDLRFRWFLGRGLSGSLLDVGCGDGRFLALAKRRGWRGTLTGLDFNKEMARRAGEGFEIHVAPLEHYKGQFDVVTLFDVFEHFARPAETIELLKSLVKPGGHLALTTPNAERLRLFTREEFDFPPHHFTRWSARAMTGLALRAGFIPVTVKAARCRPRDFSEQFFYRLFSASLPLAKRVLFGKGADSGKSVETLAAERGRGGALADRSRRKRIENALRILFNAVTYPFFGLVCLVLAVARPRSGPGLYMLARRRE